MPSFIHKRPHLDIATNEITYLVNEADNPACSTADCRYSICDHRCREKNTNRVRSNFRLLHGDITGKIAVK